MIAKKPLDLVRDGCSLIVILSFFSCINLLPTRFYLLEINRNMGAYYLLAHFLAFVFVLILGSRVLVRPRWILWSLLQLGFIAFYCSPWLHFYRLSPACPAVTGRTVKLLYANVRTSNSDKLSLANVIREKSPDIIGLLEVNQQWLRALNLSEQYPYKVEIPREDNFGLALYSRFPLSAAIPEYGDDDFVVPAIIRKVELTADLDFDLALAHAIPPLTAANYMYSRTLLQRIAVWAKNHHGRLVVAGDFNATPYSEIYQKFTGAGMHPAAQGSNIFTTWNAQSAIFKLMLDHILFKGCVNLKSYERLPEIGSDHYPLLVELEF